MVRLAPWLITLRAATACHARCPPSSVLREAFFVPMPLCVPQCSISCSAMASKPCVGQSLFCAPTIVWPGAEPPAR